MFDVACIGVLTADVITKTVDRLPDTGKLARVDSLQLYSGGCAMSASVDLGKLGAKVAIVGKVGQDGFGRFLLDVLENNHVNADGVISSPDSATSASVVLVDSKGERSFLHDIGANGTFTEADVNYKVLEQANIVFVGGTLLMPKFDGRDCGIVLKRMQEIGKTTVLDTAWDDTGRWMDAVGPSLPYVDYFIPSVEEAEMLSGKSEQKDQADVFFEYGVKSVVIKLGSRGCYLRENKDAEGILLPSYSRIKAVDTTGAGDSFCAGFLYGLSHGMSAEESCRLANAVGAHCVMAVGATTGIRPYEEIKKFMDTYGRN